MSTREEYKNGLVRRIIAEAGIAHHVRSEAEVEDMRRAVLDEIGGAEVWVFGYGSLMWNPAFHYAERRKARLPGYHRRYSFWTPTGRGSPDNPGLMLGLEPGGECFGLAFRVEAGAVEEETHVVWQREMVGGSYFARWLDLDTDDGPIKAICFVVNPDNDRYAGDLAEDDIVEILATAHGRLGSAADYLASTVEHLDALGIPDRDLTRLRDRVLARHQQP